eukprot:COSAG02_NODE_20593_length_824_cov_0.666207_1_plen_40_part_10
MQLEKFSGDDHVSADIESIISTDRLYVSGSAWHTSAFGPA